MTTPFAPLAGVRIIDITHVLAGPYCTQLLAMLGAEVIKIEPPETGDLTRFGGPVQELNEQLLGLAFCTQNMSKSSITVDLKDEDELETLRRWITSEVDVVVQNLKPGNVQKLGLDAKTLLKLKPELVYANIGAFGRAGPYSEKPGYDPLMQAFGGPMSITGHPGQPPVRTGFSAIDQGTGMWCALGVVSALNQRHQTGVGGEIDTALFETAVAWTNIVASSPLNGGAVPGAYGSGVGGIVPYQAFECSDGWLVLGCGTDGAFARFCEIVERPQWLTDERFATNPARVNNRDAIIERISELMVRETRAWWTERLDTVSIPNAPIQDIGEVMNHPQTLELGMRQELGDGLNLFALPLSFDGDRPLMQRGAPKLGEHTSAVLDSHRSRRDT